MRPNLLPYVATLALLLASGSCASHRKAREAQAEAEKAATVNKAIAQAPTPEQKLGALVQAYPELSTRKTRVIRQVDTLVVKEVVVDASIPVVTSPATDTALVNSLLQQLATAGQLVTKAQANALQRSLLPVLAKRPGLSRDTTRVIREGLEVKAWVDARGNVRVKTRKLQQRLPYVSELWDIQLQPVVVEKLKWYQVLWVALKSYFWLGVGLTLVVLFFIVRSFVRSKQVAT